MKIENQHITDIKTRFADVNCKRDLIDLINHANGLLYGDNYKSLTEKGFNYYVNPKLSKKRYTSFSVKKKSGGERTIHAPVNGLKHVLRPLNLILNCVAEPHFKATGFVPGKSIVDNAKQHIGNHYVYNIDLTDFFHSIDRSWVKYGFMLKPFNLGREKEDLAFLLASLCTHPFDINGELKTVLPQGAPTSPTITNILCVKLDRRLNGLAKRFNITYTRYADDITFSSATNVFRKEEFLEELHRIIKEQKLEINPSKTRLQQNGYRQEVTGLIVNNKVNVNTRYIKQIRNWLYLWERYGYKKAEQKFKLDYIVDKGHVKKGDPSFENVLSGKLEYLKMVKGGSDGTYLKLRSRFEKLKDKDSEIKKVLNLWENEGIKRASALYQLKEKYNSSLSHFKILFALNEINKQPMNKFGFIKQILENEKFNIPQKERFLKLVTNELENTNGREIELIKDVDVIKKKLGLDQKNEVTITAEEWFEDDSQLFDDENIQNKNYLKELLTKVTLKYLKPTKKNMDPRNTSLNERIIFLSKVIFQNFNDTRSSLERIKEKHGSLDSKKALKSINRQYFMVKQVEILKGEYKPIGISKDTYIIPPGITKDLIERFDEAIKKTKDRKNESNKLDQESDEKSIKIKQGSLQKALEKSAKIAPYKKKYHDPNKVNNWLKYFTTDNTAIKFSTHVWDDNLYATYEDYINKLNDEYLKYDFHSLQKYNSDLYWNKIYPFLFQKKLTSLEISGKKAFGWGRYKIALGWQYPSVVKDFCEENFDNKGQQVRTPHTIDLAPELVPKDIPGKTIKTFENLVDLFKPEIEFRENQLWVGVKIALKKYLPNHNVDEILLNKLKGCSFYTNTEYVLKAISRIFNMIKSRSESQDVNISCVLDIETNQYILEILHLNSYSDMEFNHPKLIAENNGDLSILRTTLLSLCDFSIESRFKDKNGDNFNAKIEYLYDNVDANEWKPNIVTIDTNPRGFKFILKFLV